MTDADTLADPLADYPVVVPVVVQWGDQDAFGHVNNTVFLRWFEVGRIAYFSEVRMMPRRPGRRPGADPGGRDAATSAAR